MITKYRVVTILFFCITFDLLGQRIDTLSNISDAFDIISLKYTQPGTHGFVLGHNHLFKQQYGEKYYIKGNATVIGLNSYHEGTYVHADTNCEFTIYSVAKNGMPLSKIGYQKRKYKDLKLNGNSTTTYFNVPVSVKDSFFIMFNLYDYAHGGYEGDTLGLMIGSRGCRPMADLARKGRNVVQFHNHNKEDWKDFYSQNFTPIATHFALFPVLESPLGTNELNTKEFKITSIYPNPFSESITVKLNRTSIEKLDLFFYNESGKVIQAKTIFQPDFDLNGEIKINCNDLSTGKYVLFIRGNYTGIGIQLIRN